MHPCRHSASFAGMSLLLLALAGARSALIAPQLSAVRHTTAPPQPPQLRRTTATAIASPARRQKPATRSQKSSPAIVAAATATAAALVSATNSAAEAAIDSTLRGAAVVEEYAKTDPALLTFEPRGITPEDTVVFIIGSVPFVWATIEFWRRIAFGESFGTGKDSVIINDTSGKRKKPQQRVLGQDAITAAYILFALAGASAVLVIVAGVDVLGS